MEYIYSLITAVFIIITCLATATAFSVGLFYLLALITDIPVDNNSLFIGSCILTGCISIMLSVFALVGKDGKHKQEQLEKIHRAGQSERERDPNIRCDR